MANEKNLVSLATRPKRERQAIGRLGAAASNKLKKERKKFKEEMLFLLSQGDIQEKISLAILEKAKKGDTKAFEVIRDTVGEKPIENMNIDVSQHITDEKLDTLVDTIYKNKEKNE
jgi:hypothetical protein